MDKTLRRISELIARELPTTPAKVLNADTDLRAAGLDSMGVVALLVALESEFQIEFPADQITWDAFTSMQSLYRIVLLCTSAEARSAET